MVACQGMFLPAQRAVLASRNQPTQIGFDSVVEKHEPLRQIGDLYLDISSSAERLCPRPSNPERSDQEPVIKSQVIKSQDDRGSARASNMNWSAITTCRPRSAYSRPSIIRATAGSLYRASRGTEEIPNPVNPMTGKAEPNGTSIIDVTDPSKPKYLRHIPGQEESMKAAARRWCASRRQNHCPRRSNAVYMLRTFGGEAHESGMSADPVNPILITRMRVEGHAQELVGMQDRHRLSGVGPARLATRR